MTFLIVAILASVNIASRFALKQYIEDQLSRINWDISAYQTGDVAAIPDITSALESTDGISAHNNLLFLRNSMTTEDIAYIDGQPIRMPWLSLLTTTKHFSPVFLNCSRASLMLESGLISKFFISLNFVLINFLFKHDKYHA